MGIISGYHSLPRERRASSPHNHLGTTRRPSDISHNVIHKLCAKLWHACKLMANAKTFVVGRDILHAFQDRKSLLSVFGLQSPFRMSLPSTQMQKHLSETQACDSQSRVCLFTSSAPTCFNNPHSDIPSRACYELSADTLNHP